MKKHLLILFILLLTVIKVPAQSAGNTGLSFLKIGAGGRNIALGDNGTVHSTDASAVFYNPANLLLASGDEILLMHNQWIQDVASEVVAARVSLFGMPVGIGINSTTISDIDIRTRPGDKEGTFNAHYFMASVSGAYAFTENLFAGATVKYLYEGLYTDQSNGWAADIGATYRNFYTENLQVSAALRNIGSMDTLRNDVTKLPSELRIGALYSGVRVMNDVELAASAEFQKYLSTDNQHVNLGLEAAYQSLFFVRLGYMTMYEAKSITTGIGLKYGRVNLDYAFLPFSYDLGNAHTVSLRVLL